MKVGFSVSTSGIRTVPSCWSDTCAFTRYQSSVASSLDSPGYRLKFLADPTLKRIHVLRPSEKILHKIIGRHGPTWLQHHSAVAHGCFVGQQIVMIELHE